MVAVITNDKCITGLQPEKTPVSLKNTFFLCTESINFWPLPQDLWKFDLLKATTKGDLAED